MANNNRHHHHGNHGPREFFTLGEHTVGSKHYRFRFDGKSYRILEKRIPLGEEDAAEEIEETLVLEETDAPKAYEAWNRIKRPERFGL